MIDSESTGVPVPFTTAAISLLLSYLFINGHYPVLATALGFAFGVVLVYFSPDSQRPSDAESLRLEAVPEAAGNMAVIMEDMRRLLADYERAAQSSRLRR